MAAGVGATVHWPAGLGAEFNEGVAQKVGGTPNAIGYVEFIFAIQNRLSYGLVRNAAGKFVQADLTTIPKAVPAEGIPADLRVSITNAADPGAYPIATFTYLLVPRKNLRRQQKIFCPDHVSIRVRMLTSRPATCAVLRSATLRCRSR